MTARAFYCGWIVGGTFVIAGFGWYLHWNAYTNLFLTLGAVVLWITALVALSPAAEPTPTKETRDLQA